MSLFPKTLMLLGSGELGKEVAIASKRLGCTVIACDRYQGAPAMQVADIFEVFDMTQKENLQRIIRKYQPDAVIPEIEALAVDSLLELEQEGINVIPTARATAITMNRDQIRNLADKELGLKTAKYSYASDLKDLIQVTKNMEWPLLIKPVMSSSGKGQSLVNKREDLANAWEVAIKGARGSSSQVIAEEFIDFDLEITLLTIRQKDGTTIFCPPIGHEQIHGDYQCSWQPAELSNEQLLSAQNMARKVTENLGGVGIYGVEFFIRGEDVIFSELSPRPHDTGLVTICSQNLNEFELHLRAILGIPIPEVICESSGASRVILAKDYCTDVGYKGLDKAMEEKHVEILIFGKPDARPGRRMGVVLARGHNISEARIKADKASSYVEVVDNNDFSKE